MSDILEKTFNDGHAEGRAEGFSEGRAEGLLEMESNTEKRYMALGPAGYTESQQEMNSVLLEKEREILKKYGCHIRRIGDSDEDLKVRGELEAYRVYEKSLT